MYEDFYGLKERPFTLTPDPKYFYMSDNHLEALEHLIYGINQGDGFIVIIGEVGTGKTTLSRILLERLGRKIATSLILNPFLSEVGLLRSILKDFGVKLDARLHSKERLMEILQDFLIEEVISKGKKAVVIIDEAQNLKLSVLEQLRVLSNLETNKEKLLQIVLFGQEELADKLSLTKLRQLNERISIRYFLGPLKKNEIAPYIYFRLKVAGASPRLKFTRAAIKRIWKFSRGKPRLINMICDRALLAGFIQQKWTIDETLIKKAEKSIKGEGRQIWKKEPWWKRIFFRNNERNLSLRGEDEFNF